MPKRRATDSDEETPVDGLTPSSKRARTTETESSDESGIEQVPLKPNRNARSTTRPVEIKDDEDEEDDQDFATTQRNVMFKDNLDEEEFEKVHADILRQKIHSKSLKSGGIAEHGVIEAIEMHQFMCHKYLTFTFGPQINFIIGHNGSGKSAVLSAITVALGGKANSTGRGSGLKSFIREGQSVSEVTIQIKNRGEEAFKPNEYGKSINITRRFTKDGSSTWKIKSFDGRVISTKREELSAICDHMNIQVDNPMNVLTQDAARQFLSASRPEEMYSFFLRGTQLTQLSEEYDRTLSNIRQTNKVLGQKREALPDLRNNLRETKVRYDEAEKAREQKKRADDLKKELAWAHVKAKEDEMTKKIGEVAKAAKRVPKLQGNVDGAKQKFDDASVKVGVLEDEFKALGTIQHLNEEKTEYQAQIKNNKRKLTDILGDMKKISQSTDALNAQIENYQKQIDAETERSASDTQAKREEQERRLDEARRAVDEAEMAYRSLSQQKTEYLSKSEATKQQGVVEDGKRDDLKQKLKQCDEMMRQCKARENNLLLPYGKDIEGVVQKINNTRWYGEKPVGPLGTYVKAKDPETWGHLLRSQLGNWLVAFAVTDARDRDTLKKILVDSGNGQIQIAICERDLFEYSHGEPPEHILTALRALEVSDPYVLRVLINFAHIERQVLAPTRKVAEQQLQSLRGGAAWSLDEFLVRVFPEGGVASTELNMRLKNDRMGLLLTGRDNKAEFEHYQRKLQGHEVEYKALLDKMDALKKEFMQYKQAYDRVVVDERKAQERFRNAKNTLSSLQQERNDDLPLNVGGLQAAKEDAEKEKENNAEMFADVVQRKADVDSIQRDLQTKLNAVKAKMQEFDDKRELAIKQLDDAVGERLNAQNEMKHYEGKLEEEKRKVAEIENTADVLQEEFKNWTIKAEEYCARVENPRKVDEVQRNLDSVVKALKAREKRHGFSVEDVAVELAKATQKLEKVEKDLKEMSMLNKALKLSLTTRLARWQEFRRHIALRCKLVFQYNLSHRGYFGKVLFEHDKGLLSIKVQTDDQSATQGHRDKDPRSLSGGEKSFSTICLLLSLWDAIGCPLRCLDEFDVFMDAVNRRISMKMMIDTANSSDQKQYVLITPQDMTNVQFGPSVRVHRMTDPERGNGVLAFSG